MVMLVMMVKREKKYPVMVMGRMKMGEGGVGRMKRGEGEKGRRT